MLDRIRRRWRRWEADRLLQKKLAAIDAMTKAAAPWIDDELYGELKKFSIRAIGQALTDHTRTVWLADHVSSSVKNGIRLETERKTQEEQEER